jgi:hypothetical protein
MTPKTWYQDCRETIYKKFTRPELFIGLLAATSPRKQVTANWRLAARIYAAVIAGQTFDARGILPSHAGNICRAIRGEELSGPKVRAFAQNLRGNLGPITIDVWVMRFYPGLSHDRIRERIERGARRLGIAPAEYQAIVWTKVRTRAGKKAVSFNTVPELWQMVFNFD